jgi:cytosine/adenosine deaminase-related metal-dependent hydrolase
MTRSVARHTAVWPPSTNSSLPVYDPAAPARAHPSCRAARELAERRDGGTAIHLDQSHREMESVMNVRSVSHNAAMAARRAAAPPILALQAAGSRIAMGTDTMAHDMLESMRTGQFVERMSCRGGERPWPGVSR